MQAEESASVDISAQHATPAAAGEALTADSNILLKDSDPKSTVILAQNAQDVLQTASVCCVCFGLVNHVPV